MTSTWKTVDGNEAAADVAYRLSEVVAIYPITPASPMGESADDWSAVGRPNLWGAVPEVVEMQSEAGAAGAMHGAVTRGSLGTSFTASQGLLLMLPNMYKIAGELTPAVLHVAARSLATHALSIFGDHSDVMGARSTGWAMLASASVQEAADFALVAHTATLETRIPFLHFFDGFRTSHEVGGVDIPGDDVLARMIDERALTDHRLRGLDPDRPVLRGSAQNPDVFFQAREAANPFYDVVPDMVATTFDRLAALTGRRYGLVDYIGAPDAERVIVLMGSGAGAAQECVEALNARGEKVGLLQVRLYRPFPAAALLAALPETMQGLAVLDRTKEPGAPAEPLYQDVVTVLAESGRALPRLMGGRYGLSSKEFTPAMVKAVFDALGDPAETRRRVTVGIHDDVTHLSLPVDDDFTTDNAGVRAVFYGLGSDGTVGANKHSAKIVGDETDLHVQGYFVYDSKKSGSMTVSHLRFDTAPIRSTYLVSRANFVACHQFSFLERVDVLSVAAPGATFLVNSPYGEETWEHLPAEVQAEIIAKNLGVYVVDAHRVARDVGLPGRINTIMQTCFFALTEPFPFDRAKTAIEGSIRSAYAKRGATVVDANLAAVQAAVPAMHRLDVSLNVTSDLHRRPPVPPDSSDFVRRVTARILAGEGDLLPVSAMPPDGTFPTGTARVEKRGIAQELPVWDESLCIDCGKCTIVCPHAVITMKVVEPHSIAAAGEAPASFRSKSFRSREHPGLQLIIQVSPDDCTGCGVCVDVCPARSKSVAKHKSIDMAPALDVMETVRANYNFSKDIESVDPAQFDPASVKGSQIRQPLFEFSGACAGCGETPYLKLLSQLFGDRIMIANATGCSSIYGGNLPTTPWGTDANGRGPAWSNSLFEDNAEFGLGIRLAYEQQTSTARALLRSIGSRVNGDILVRQILDSDPAAAATEAEIAVQRERVAELNRRLDGLVGSDPLAARLRSMTGALVRKSVWIVGGDGWAYDIGYGGLDHVLASGRDVNVVVLDTEVYSNTGGQASKATPRAAVAKFAAAGKPTAKKDLGMEAVSYGNVYVAQVAMGANDIQTVKAFLEAEAWHGPSLIIAYSTCIAHGIEMSTSMAHQKDAVRSGYWPLFRYHPGAEEHTHPFQLDSKEPVLPLTEFVRMEGRYAILRKANPEHASELLEAAQQDITERWRYYQQLAGLERVMTAIPAAPAVVREPADQAVAEAAAADGEARKKEGEKQ